MISLSADAKRIYYVDFYYTISGLAACVGITFSMLTIYLSKLNVLFLLDIIMLLIFILLIKGFYLKIRDPKDK